MKVEIVIDWVPNNFAAAPASGDIACVATGGSLDEVERKIIEALRFHIDGMKESGDRVPKEYLSEWEPEFSFTTRAQLKYLDGFISRKALARETGIAEQQLSHYANGQRHPRPAMQNRITSGIRSLMNRMSMIL
ncbi:MAG: helix-turn-helix domain-containing protein [Bacteroidales bacterium]|nr:helix-turn-helix domain-containing protein [Bacteroidales bacterium]